MALIPGTHLGPYEVTAQIGVGGMGEVYRARDTKLGRDVAIKVLPEAVASDAERVARFEREAKTLAQLNHPNIAAIYGLEEADGLKALVMELVEGPTLADRIAQGAIPVGEALPIAKQITEALEAAHEQGIIHRDLKPANIKVRPDGTVKVLDFGLAKAMEAPGAMSASASQAPTITTPAMMTGVGMILGTAAYMAPEQARGRAVDKRADIWAFGAVLFEMLAGLRPFDGEDMTEVLGAVVRLEPQWDALPSTVPAPVSQVLRVCLRKDAKQRAGDIRDVRLALDGAFESAAPPTMPMTTASPTRGRLVWMTAFAVAIAAVLAVPAVQHLRETPVEQPRRQLAMPLAGSAAPSFFALSPDGRSFVMERPGKGLEVRSLESGEVRSLTGTELARTPFWSPDSRTIAFFNDGKLRTVAASGGPTKALCDEAGNGSGGTWNRADIILFAASTGVLTRVSAGGGPCVALTKPEPGIRRAVPVFLPDGNHFLHVVIGVDEARRGMYVASLNEPNGHRLLADVSSALFVSNAPRANQGRLLFVRERRLMAQAFDASSLQLSGEPGVVADQVAFTAARPQIAASIDANGTLTYLADGSPGLQLVWYDRSGKKLDGVEVAGVARGVSLAPSGAQFAFRHEHEEGQGNSLWVWDSNRKVESRLVGQSLVPGAGVWSPDGRRIAFGATAGPPAIYVTSVDGGMEEILLRGNANEITPSDWSHDDRWLVFTEIDPKTGGDIRLLPNPSAPLANRRSAGSGRPEPAKGRTPVTLLRTTATESQGQISPDGKWLAYVSNESGTERVYVAPFAGASPIADPKWQVSPANGFEPRWRADGKELFYLEAVPGTRRLKMVSVQIGAGPNPVGEPNPLFEFQSQTIVMRRNVYIHSPSADGQRFLVNADAPDSPASLEVILNWGSTPFAK